ncbi:hypothetical protein FA10DRAFT_152196 [Acaromyces ingoldii]|uniref:Uncharacterized protein n=1 Tax=Acaromyces ingoldii TaxID=215250 RepID=A0A316YM34_9BASI|nr:hypothetical protein FA10DRAFT_152196 [Acaromyces ingoldii]PWN89718.1 hypothetical protein FA10DRAFT_152196 [Acaromyces ingoldii]
MRATQSSSLSRVHYWRPRVAPQGDLGADGAHLHAAVHGGVRCGDCFALVFLYSVLVTGRITAKAPTTRGMCRAHADVAWVCLPRKHARQQVSVLNFQ